MILTLSEYSVKKELEKQDCSVLKETQGMSTGHKAEMRAGLNKPAAKTILGEMEKFEYELATK